MTMEEDIEQMKQAIATLTQTIDKKKGQGKILADLKQRVEEDGAAVRVHSSPMALPRFDGGLEADWPIFTHKFAEYCNASFLSKEQSVRLLPVCLSGAAKVHYTSLDSTTRADYDSAIEQMRQHFCDTPEKIAFAKSQLLGLQRKAGETLIELADRITRITRRAYPDLSKDAQKSGDAINIIAGDYFVSSLDQDVAKVVRRKEPKKIEDALAFAQAEETQVEMDRISRRSASGDANIAQVLSDLSSKLSKLEVQQAAVCNFVQQAPQYSTPRGGSFSSFRGNSSYGNNNNYRGGGSHRGYQNSYNSQRRVQFRDQGYNPGSNQGAYRNYRPQHQSQGYNRFVNYRGGFGKYNHGQQQYRNHQSRYPQLTYPHSNNMPQLTYPQSTIMPQITYPQPDTIPQITYPPHNNWPSRSPSRDRYNNSRDSRDRSKGPDRDRSRERMEAHKSNIYSGGAETRSVNHVSPMDSAQQLTSETNGSHRPMSPSSMLPLFPFLITLALACALPSIGAYQLCGHGRQGFLMEPPELSSCATPPNTTMPMYSQVDLYSRVDKPSKVEAHLCYIMKRRVCTETWFFHAGVKDDNEWLENATPEDCREMSSAKQVRGINLTSINERSWRGSNDSGRGYSFAWLGSKCTESSTYILEVGTIASFDGVSIASDLTDYGKCKLEAGVCSTQHGYSIWDTANISKPCPYEKLGRFIAQVSPPHVLIESKQLGLLLDRNLTFTIPCHGSVAILHKTVSTYAISFPIIQSKQPIAVWMENNKAKIDLKNRKISAKLKADRISKSMNSSADYLADNILREEDIDSFLLMNDQVGTALLINRTEESRKKSIQVTHILEALEEKERNTIARYISHSGLDEHPAFGNNLTLSNRGAESEMIAKLQFLAKTLSGQLHEKFRETWNSLCELKNSDKAMNLALLRNDPTTGARAILRRDDISAEFRGEVIAIYLCQEANVSKIYRNNKIGERCFSTTPVIVDGRTYFVQPGTKDLSTKGVQIPCSALASPVFKGIDGVWRTAGGNIHVQSYPEQEEVKGEQPMDILFEAPPMFTFESLRLTTIVDLLTHKMNKENPQFSTPHERANSLDGSLNELVAEGVAFGTEIGKMSESLTSHVMDGIEEYVSSIQTTIRIISIAVIVIGIPIGLVVLNLYFPWLFAFCRCSGTTSRKPSNAPRSDEQVEMGSRQQQEEIPLRRLTFREHLRRKNSRPAITDEPGSLAIEEIVDEQAPRQQSFFPMVTYLSK